MMIVLLVAIVYVPMLIEARRAAQNERAQLAIGGFEPQGDVYRLMQAAYPGTFAAMIGEAALRGGPPAGAVAMGLAVFALGKALKWWAILTLGQAWTFRVIVVPATRRIRSGPYRYFDHPNYVGVVGELVGAALMTGALLTGPVATVLFSLLMLKRIAVENRAVKENLADC